MPLLLSEIILNAFVLNYVLKETITLNGLGLMVIPSTKSSVDGSSPGTVENVNACNRVVAIINVLLLAKFSPIQRRLPIVKKK